MSYEVDFKPNPELVGRVIKFLNKRITRDGISGRGQESNKRIWTESSNATKEKALECLTPVKDNKKSGPSVASPSVTHGGSGRTHGHTTHRPTSTTLPSNTYSQLNKKSIQRGSRISSKPRKEKSTRIQELKAAQEAPPSPHSPTAFSKKLVMGMRNVDVKEFTSKQSPTRLHYSKQHPH